MNEQEKSQHSIQYTVRSIKVKKSTKFKTQCISEIDSDQHHIKTKLQISCVIWRIKFWITQLDDHNSDSGTIADYIKKSDTR
jgi:hypothetical protein